MKRMFFAGADDLYRLGLLLEYKIKFIAIDFNYVTENKLNTKILSLVEQNSDVVWMLYATDPSKLTVLYRNWGNSGGFTYILDYPMQFKTDWSGDQVIVGPLYNEEKYSFIYLDNTVSTEALIPEIDAIHLKNKKVLLVNRRNALKYPVSFIMAREWLASEKFGVTYIFNNDMMIRLSKKEKELRSSHTAVYKELGLDSKKILADDPEEILRLSIISWKLYSDRISNLYEIYGDNEDNKNIGYNIPIVGSVAEKNEAQEIEESVQLDLTLSPTTSLVPAVKRSGLGRPTAQVGCNSCPLKGECEHYKQDYMCCLNEQFKHYQDLSIPGLLKTMRELIEEQTTRLNKALYVEEKLHQGIPTEKLNRELTSLQQNYMRLMTILQEREKINIQKSNLLKDFFGDAIEVEAEEVKENKPPSK